MPNMPIYNQQTTPNGNMAVQAQAVNVRDPYGPAIQDLGQGIASLGQNLGNIQRVQIERANQLQADKDELWAASTVADIDIKMTKRMADLSVDPTVTKLTPVIEKEIDTMLEENGKDASDQQKKLLDKRSVGFRRELITAAIGRDVAHSIATTEASLEKLSQSTASKIAFNAPNRTWDPAERAVAAWKADQEVSAEIDKAHIAPQQRLVQKAKLKAGLVDAYMGRFVEVDPDMAMATLSGEIKDGPVAEMVKQIPASAIDSYASRAQQNAAKKFHETKVGDDNAKKDADNFAYRSALIAANQGVLNNDNAPEFMAKTYDADVAAKILSLARGAKATPEEYYTASEWVTNEVRKKEGDAPASVAENLKLRYPTLSEAQRSSLIEQAYRPDPAVNAVRFTRKTLLQETGKLFDQDAFDTASFGLEQELKGAGKVDPDYIALELKNRYQRLDAINNGARGVRYAFPAASTSGGTIDLRPGDEPPPVTYEKFQKIKMELDRMQRANDPQYPTMKREWYYLYSKFRASNGVEKMKGNGK